MVVLRLGTDRFLPSSNAEVEILKRHEQYIHCKIKDIDQTSQILLTLVYGLHTVTSRQPLWQELRLLAGCCQLEDWVVMGDFNDLMNVIDRENGNPVTYAEIRDLSQVVVDAQLNEFFCSGPYHSWEWVREYIVGLIGVLATVNGWLILVM